MKNLYILLIVLAIAFTSCQESAKMDVQNIVHNATLENMNYGNYSLGYAVFPGETSSILTITDNKESWPKNSPIEFYMLRDGNRVFLQTKFGYQLNISDNIHIIISDSTEVVSPYGKKAGTLADFK